MFLRGIVLFTCSIDLFYTRNTRFYLYQKSISCSSNIYTFMNILWIVKQFSHVKIGYCKYVFFCEDEQFSYSFLSWIDIMIHWHIENMQTLFNTLQDQMYSILGPWEYAVMKNEKRFPGKIAFQSSDNIKTDSFLRKICLFWNCRAFSLTSR